MKRKTSYQYPTELMHDAFWGGTPSQHKIGDRVMRSPVRNSQAQRCAICGRNDFEYGFNTYETTPRTNHLGSVLSSNFGEQFSLAAPHSPVTCPFCESVVRDQFRALNGVVADPEHVFLIVGKGKADASDTRIKRILTGDYFRLMLEPPSTGPFIFSFNRNGVGKNGTHFIYLATVNYNRDRYVISFYDEKILVDRQFLLEVWDRIVHKDPTNNAMSTGALMAGVRAAETAALREAAENDRKTGTFRKNTAALRPAKGKSQKIFEGSDFSTDPEFLKRALQQDNFRTLELFFMSIASLNANAKKKPQEAA